MNVPHVLQILIYYDYYFEEKRTTKKAMTPQIQDNSTSEMKG